MNVSCWRGGCSGLFSENESSRLQSPARVRCQRVNSAAYEKNSASDVRHRGDSECLFHLQRRCRERSGLFPENESSLLENHAPVRCRRVNPATDAKEF
jgi:hypothetical protein